VTGPDARQAADEDAVANTTVRSYTRAVRHPLVLGRVGGYQLPFQLTVPQLIVGALGVLAALAIRPLLADVVGARVSLAVVAVAVFTGVVVAKRVRAEGRNSLQALAGVVEYVTGSGPRVHGRRVKTSTRRHTRWPTVVPVVDVALPPRPKELPRPANVAPPPTIPTARALHASLSSREPHRAAPAPAAPRPQGVLATRAATRDASPEVGAARQPEQVGT
jgi:hypothetical protein